MIIKTDDFELEISKDGEVYVGSLATGQAFLNWGDIDDKMKSGLEEIIGKAEELVKDSENLISERLTASLQGRINNAVGMLNI